MSNFKDIYNLRLPSSETNNWLHQLKCYHKFLLRVRKDKLKDHIKKHHPHKAVDKGWLTAAEAAKVRPSARHRSKSSAQPGEKSEGTSEATADNLPKKNPAQFENLVEEILKAQEPQQQHQQQTQCIQANQQRTTRVVLQIDQQSNEQPLQQPLTMQTQLPVMQQLSPVQIIPPIQGQISSPMPHQSTVMSLPSIKSQTLMNVSQSSMLPHSQLQTGVTEMIQGTNEQVQQMIPYNQAVQGPGSVPVVPGSQQYPSIPTSSTLSEEVYQFVTYTGQPRRSTRNNGQCSSNSTVVSGQMQMGVLGNFATNTRDVPGASSQLPYYSGPASQNPRGSDQWR